MATFDLLKIRFSRVTERNKQAGPIKHPTVGSFNWGAGHVSSPSLHQVLPKRRTQSISVHQNVQPTQGGQRYELLPTFAASRPMFMQSEYLSERIFLQTINFQGTLHIICYFIRGERIRVYARVSEIQRGCH